MKKKIKTVKRQIDTGVLHRTFSLAREEVNEEDRTVKLSFSSETPVERWFGTEILSHEPKACDLGRLRDDGPLLVDHDRKDHVGVIEKVSIDKDKVGRATVRFGQGTRASEIFQDVLDGIRSKISVGYRIHEMLEDTKKNTYTATRWEPFEVSFVSIPADASVGVGRSEREPGEKFETNILSEREVRTMNKFDKDGNLIDDDGNIIKTRAQLDAEKPQPKVDANAEREQIRKDELKRTSEIRALGKQHGQEEKADAAIAAGTPVERARIEILEARVESAPIGTIDRSDNDLGLSQKEIHRFSYARAIYALANPQSRAALEAAAFEIECSNAVAAKRGIDPQGFFVPEMSRNGFVSTDAEGKYTPGIAVPREVQSRADLNVTTDAQGGHLVDTDLMSGSFIDVLRNELAIAGMGATILDDLVGDIAIPGKLAAGQSAWLATEGADAVQSDMTFRQVAMTPKTAATFTEFTRQFLLQSSLGVDNLIRNDIAAGMALLLDYAALYGTGAAGQPRGIALTSGIGNPTTWAAATPTWAEVVALESAVSGANALKGSLGYLMETAMRGSLKTTSKAGTEAIFVMGEGNELNGYKTQVSNQIVSGDMFFGNWADLIVGLWGNLDLLIDPYSNSLSGTIRVVAHQSMDVAVRHAASFALGNATV